MTNFNGYFVCYSGDAIYGIGRTELDAVNDALDGGVTNTDQMPTAPATPALAEAVLDQGGAVAFHKLRDGRIGTWAEYEAQQ